MRVARARDGALNSYRRRWIPSLLTTVAKLSKRYDLTIIDLEPEVRKELHACPDLRDHALWLLGEPGKGKTPLGRIVAMMFSRFHGGDGSFRTTSDLDFFKGIPFTKAVPALYDDGSIGNEETKKEKAFADVGDDEPMTRNQLRIVLDNSYNPEQEPEDHLNPEDLVVSHRTFKAMIRPALGEMSDADAMAIMKRSVFTVIGKNISCTVCPRSMKFLLYGCVGRSTTSSRILPSTSLGTTRRVARRLRTTTITVHGSRDLSVV